MIPLCSIMVYKTDRMKNFAGWIMEAIFLIFIVSINYAPADAIGFKKKDASFTSSSVLIHSDVWRSNQLGTDSDIDLNAPSTDWHLRVMSINLLVTKISNAQPFFIRLFERSIYLFITTNAP